MYYFSNEIVFAGHPDKVCDAISDNLLDAFLKQDKNSRCGIEVMGGKGKIFVTGEVTSGANVNVESAVKYVLSDIGYRTDYEIINNLGVQSKDIAQGVDTGGAGDQGMMFGYACRETDKYLPKAVVILQELSRFYESLSHKDNRFLPDGKAQITGIYNEHKELIGIKDFTVSYQNTEIERDKTDKIIMDYIKELCHKYSIDNIGAFHINPTGKFLIGGFDADAGLTGRKIVVDNYQSFANVGGGAFSGKDCTKVDRSAAYAARYVATKVDRSGAYKARQLAIECLDSLEDLNWCEVQLSYAIGISEPLAIYVKTDEGIITDMDWAYKECSLSNIIKDLDLLNVRYYDAAKHGHFGNSKFPWERTSSQRVGK